MKNNELVFLDAFIGLFLLPLTIFFRYFKKTISLFLLKKNEGILIVKFLGAGNYLAIKNDISALKMLT